MVNLDSEVPHINVDRLYFKGSGEPRGDTCSKRGGEAKDAGMAGVTRIINPDKVRELQITFYRKAKASPGCRFWSLSQNCFRRWRWRKHAGRKSLWKDYPTDELHTRYGLYELPITAKWKAAR